MNNRSWGYQIQLALLVGVVAAILILIVALVTREERAPPLGASIGGEPSIAPLDIIPQTAVRTGALPSHLQRPTPKPVVEKTLNIGRTQTIEDITIGLIRAEVTDQGLRIVYSADPSPYEWPPDVPVQDIGEPSIKFSDGHVSVSDRHDLSDDYEAIIFSDDTRLPAAGESVTVSMGSYIISAPDLAGSVDIPLNDEYRNLDYGQEVTAETLLEIEDAQFRVFIVNLDTSGTRADVVPVNEPAQRIVLEFGNASVFLTDDRSSKLNVHNRKAVQEDDIDSPLNKSQSFGFSTRIEPDATSLTFSIQGGGRIIGPFIFEDVHLVSE